MEESSLILREGHGDSGGSQRRCCRQEPVEGRTDGKYWESWGRQERWTGLAGMEGRDMEFNWRKITNQSGFGSSATLRTYLLPRSMLEIKIHQELCLNKSLKREGLFQTGWWSCTLFLIKKKKDNDNNQTDKWGETWYKKAKEVGIAGLVYLELIHDIEA